MFVSEVVVVSDTEAEQQVSEGERERFPSLVRARRAAQQPLSAAVVSDRDVYISKGGKQ